MADKRGYVSKSHPCRELLPPTTVASNMSHNAQDMVLTSNGDSTWEQEEILLPTEESVMVNIVQYFGSTQITHGEQRGQSCTQIMFHLEQRPEWEDGTNRQCQGALGRYICRAGAKASCPLTCRLICNDTDDDASTPRLLFTCAYSGTTQEQPHCCPFRFTVAWLPSDDECDGGWIIQHGGVRTHMGHDRPSSLEDALRVPNHGKFIVARSNPSSSSTSRIPFNDGSPKISTKCLVGTATSDATPINSGRTLDNSNSDHIPQLHQLEDETGNIATVYVHQDGKHATSRNAAVTSASGSVGNTNISMGNTNISIGPQRQHDSETCNSGSRSDKLEQKSTGGSERESAYCSSSPLDDSQTNPQPLERATSVESWTTEEILLPTQNGLVNIIPYIGPKAPRGNFVKLHQNLQWKDIQNLCVNARAYMVGRDLGNGNVQFVCTHSKHVQEPELNHPLQSTTNGMCRFRFSVTWLPEDRCWAVKTGLGCPVHSGHTRPDDDAPPLPPCPSRKRMSSFVDAATITEHADKHPRLETGTSSSDRQPQLHLHSNNRCESVVEANESARAPQNGESALGNKPIAERWTTEELLLPTKDGLVNVVPFIGRRKHRGSRLKLEQRSEWRNGNDPACRKSLSRFIREACGKGGVRVFSEGFRNNAITFCCAHKRKECCFRFSLSWCPTEACWAVIGGSGCPEHIGHARPDGPVQPPFQLRKGSLVGSSTPSVLVQGHAGIPCQDSAAVSDSFRPDVVRVPFVVRAPLPQMQASLLNKPSSVTEPSGNSWRPEGVFLPTDNGPINVMEYVGSSNERTLTYLQSRPEWCLTPDDDDGRKAFVQHIREAFCAVGSPVVTRRSSFNRLGFMCAHEKSVVNGIYNCKDDKKREMLSKRPRCLFRFAVKWVSARACWALVGGFGCNIHCGHSSSVGMRDTSTPPRQSLFSLDVSQKQSKAMEQQRKEISEDSPITDVPCDRMKLLLPTDHGPVDVLKYIGSECRAILVKLQPRPQWHFSDCGAGRRNMISDVRQACSSVGYPVLAERFSCNQQDFVCQYSVQVRGNNIATEPVCSFRFALVWLEGEKRWAFVGGYGCGVHSCHANGDCYPRLRLPSVEVDAVQYQVAGSDPVGDFRQAGKDRRALVTPPIGEAYQESATATSGQLEEFVSYEPEGFDRGPAVARSEHTKLPPPPPDKGSNYYTKSLSVRKNAPLAFNESSGDKKRSFGIPSTLACTSTHEDSDEVEVVGVFRPFKRNVDVAATSRASISSRHHPYHLHGRAVVPQESGTSEASHIANQLTPGNRLAIIDPTNVPVENFGTPSNLHERWSYENSGTPSNLHDRWSYESCFESDGTMF